jgi:hypothetical protein
MGRKGTMGTMGTMGTIPRLNSVSVNMDSSPGTLGELLRELFLFNGYRCLQS